MDSHVEVIKGVFGKLKNRAEAANEDKFTGPISYLGYTPSPIIPIEGGFRALLDPFPDLYPNEVFFQSKKNRKLLKHVSNTQLDQLRSVELSPDSDIFNLLEGSRKNEKRVLIDGIIYGNGMLRLNPKIYDYFDYFPDFGKSLFLTLGKARGFENNLESKTRELFGTKFNAIGLEDSVRNLYRKQIEEVIRKSLLVVEKLYREADRVENEHSVYDDNVTTNYISAEYHRDMGEPVPEYSASAENLIDPDSKYLQAKMQEKHVVILEKVNNEISKLSKELTSINLSMFLFLSTFKSLKESGVEFSLEDINSSSFKETLGTNISPQQVAEMKQIYATNQSANPEVQNELVSNFESRLKDGKTWFYTFSYSGNTQSFIAFTPKEDGSSYASAFNVAPDARGYKIGEAMLHEAMDKEAHEHILTADCDSTLPISAKYIETGWVATRYWDDHGDKVLDITRNDKERERYLGKQLSNEDIIAGKVADELRVETGGEQKDLPFHLCNEGFVLTRMFFDQKGRQHYAVFEPVPPAHTEQEKVAGVPHK